MTGVKLRQMPARELGGHPPGNGPLTRRGKLPGMPEDIEARVTALDTEVRDLTRRLSVLTDREPGRS